MEFKVAPKLSAFAQTLKKRGGGGGVEYTFLLVSVSYNSVISKIDETCVYWTSESKICSSKMYILIGNLKNDSVSSNINIQQCLVMLLRNDSHQTLLDVLVEHVLALQVGGRVLDLYFS